MKYQGQLLVAAPALADSIFDRSVVLLCEHNDAGAMGIILNKESPIQVNQLKEVYPSVKNFDQSFYVGGPVNQEEVHALHDMKNSTEVHLEVQPDLFLTTNPSFLKSVSGAQLNYRFMRFFLGYSGWESGQLEAEIERGSWYVCPYKFELIRDTPPQKLWSRAMYFMGSDYACKAYLPKNPSLN